MILSTPIRRGVIGLVLALTLALATPAGAGAADGWLQQTGTTLRDTTGAPVLLTSAESVGPVTDTTINLIRQAGLNSMRVPVAWSNIEPNKPTLAAGGGLNHAWSSGQLNYLDAQVNRLAAAGIRVVLEMHQSQWSNAFTGARSHAFGIPKWLYPNAPRTKGGDAEIRFYRNVSWPGFSLGTWQPQALLIEAWKMLAQRYRSNSWVAGVDLINEPGWPSTDTTGLGLPSAQHLLTFYRNAANAIHAINPRLLIIYETGTYAQAAYRGGTILDASTGGLNEPNSMASWHYYPAPPMSTRQFQLLIDQWSLATRWNQPLWIGEFNAYNGGFDKSSQQTFGAAWKALTIALMQWTKAHGVGWSFWAFQRGAGATLMARNGVLKSDLVNALRLGQ